VIATMKSKYFLVIAAALLASGCASDQINRRLDNLDAQLVTLTAQERKNECLAKYNMATSSCMALHMGERGGPEVIHRVDACTAVKGFPRGPDTCQ
jgi:PBP1b-binding outer membrane lipoprotein LpoB